MRPYLDFHSVGGLNRYERCSIEWKSTPVQHKNELNNFFRKEDNILERRKDNTKPPPDEGNIFFNQDEGDTLPGP